MALKGISFAESLKVNGAPTCTPSDVTIVQRPIVLPAGRYLLEVKATSGDMAFHQDSFFQTEFQFRLVDY